MKTKSLDIFKVDQYEIEYCHGLLVPSVTEFVAKAYYNRKDFHFNITLEKLIEKLLLEDIAYIKDSYVFTVYDKMHNILGTIRMIIKTENNILPIEREFDIDLNQIQNEAEGKFFEVARMAVEPANMYILRLLIDQVLKNFHKQDIALASLDIRVLKRLRTLKLPWVDFGNSKVYLGSITCPVYLRINSIIEYPQDIYKETISYRDELS